MKKEKHLFDELAELIHQLQLECPRAKEYTLQSHKEELLSETLEVKEAVEKEDWENLKEELGDVLHDWFIFCKIAEKQGLFTTEDVLRHLREKIHRRNPHVFGNAKAKTTEDVIKLRDEIKKLEKEGK